MWRTYLQPTTLSDALALLERHAGNARLVAGGTDLVVELSRAPRPDLTIIDVTAIPGLGGIREEDGTIVLGALATHNAVLASPVCRQRALPLVQACWEIGAPQLRTRATVTGNVVTGSPANDTISALLALDATLTIVSVVEERRVALRDFYTGPRRTVLQPNELVREITFRALGTDDRGIFLKLGLRRAQAISVVHLAIVLSLEGERVREARIALGSVAPTVIRSGDAEQSLIGQRLTADVCRAAGELAAQAAAPIDDIRGSARYRRTTLARLTANGLRRIADGTMAEGLPERPVLLETATAPPAHAGSFAGTIETTVNSRPHRFPKSVARKTLLAALRDDVGLTGSKEGCAEGECGACTVWLNGQAALACLIPAAQAHGAIVTTIEGLAGADGTLHPLQQAFVDCGAVQCGFCIPGCVMAAAKLLDERLWPTIDETRTALSGNLCRCTGYRSMLQAVQSVGVGPE